MTYYRYLFNRAVYFAVDVVALLPAIVIAAISRIAPRPVDVGLGPLPTINSRYHKLCLERFGYSCETFVYYTWYFTSDFDVHFGRHCPRPFAPYVAFVACLFRYRCLYTYFNGGPLGATTLLARCEPLLLRLAGIKTVVMPYGSDVHVLTRTPNRLLVHAIVTDYPETRYAARKTAALLDLWTLNADHVISGNDWVHFMYHWDTLMLSHFAVDTDAIGGVPGAVQVHQPEAPLRLIHAPNHRNIKGTQHIIRAVEELRAEGVAIELSVVERVPNTELLTLVQSADVVVDQLVIGWYAMFAIEAMALGKPVVCHVRHDLRELYIGAGLLEPGELPLVEASILTIKETLRHLADTPRSELRELGQRSRAYVEKHHSLNAVGSIFDGINRSLGVHPSGSPPAPDPHGGSSI